MHKGVLQVLRNQIKVRFVTQGDSSDSARKLHSQIFMIAIFFTCLVKTVFCGLYVDILISSMKWSTGFLQHAILNSVPFALSCERQEEAEFIYAN